MRRPVIALVLAAALTVALWWVPFGRVLTRPLLWWSTLAHESGHGLAAVFAGGTWARLQLFLDGSGVATTHVADGMNGLVPLGGLIGPAVAASVLFLLGAFQRPARITLAGLGMTVLALVPTVASGMFTLTYVVVLGGLLVLTAARTSTKTAQIVLLFLAVQLALSVFSRADYLFMPEATTGAGTMPSDVTHVANHFGGGIFLWGTLIAGVSVLVLLGGLAFLLGVDRTLVRLQSWRSYRRCRAKHGAEAEGT